MRVYDIDNFPKILSCHGNIDANIFTKLRQVKVTRGYDFTLLKGQTR